MMVFLYISDFLAYRKPYIFIVHFASVEIIKIDGKAFRSPSTPVEKSVMELTNPRFLGLAGPRGIYVSTVNSILEILKIEGISNAQTNSGSMTSLDSL